MILDDELKVGWNTQYEILFKKKVGFSININLGG